MIDELIKYAKRNPDGFTVEIETLQPVTAGFAVAFQATQDSHDLEGLQKCLEHAAQYDKKIGGWFDTESGKWYWDSIRILTNENEAVEFGREQKQIAIYQIESSRLIKL